MSNFLDNITTALQNSVNSDLDDNLNTAFGDLDVDNSGVLTDFGQVVDEFADALDKLNNGISSASGIRFPSDISQNYVTFTPQPRTRAMKKDGAKAQSGGGGITLPIPSNMSTGYNAQYDTGTGIGVLGNFTTDQMQAGTIPTAAQTGQAVAQQMAAIGLSASPEIMALVGAGLSGTPIGAGVGAALGGIAQGAALGAGIAANPHLAVIFTGVNFRSHTFTYKFSPRDASESATIKNIITRFKKHMHPDVEGPAFFKYPDEYAIKFSGKNEDYMFNFGSSVLTDLQVNYNPDGGSYFHDNGAPVSVGLQLTFTEIDILTKDQIAKGR